MPFTKQERERNKAILLATLNYLIEYQSGDMVFDDYSPSKQWYLNDLKQTERDIQNSRSQQIKKRLDMHLAMRKHYFDLGLNSYIKEKTGYHIDIFEEFKTQVAPIIAKGTINDNDVYKVKNYLKAYSANPEEQDNIYPLKTLLAKREATIKKWISNGDLVFTKGEFITNSNGKLISPEEHKKFMDSWLMYEVMAPNGIHKLSVQISGKGEHALTYVNITLGGGVGGVYGAIGERLPLNVYWKNNHHVVIETSKEYQVSFSYQQVSSYGEVVKIEYAELQNI